jgi:hypothetical protein
MQSGQRTRRRLRHEGRFLRVHRRHRAAGRAGGARGGGGGRLLGCRLLFLWQARL